MFTKDLFSLWKKKMNLENVVDVSSFLLFEATGDSEGDCNTIKGGGDDKIGQDIAMADDDDAESCIFDLSDFPRVSEVDDSDIQPCVHDDDDDDGGGDDDDDEEEDEDEDKDEVLSYRKSTGKQDWKLMGHQKSSVSVDTSKDSMNEAERSRLFWETCLAS
ncbi:hypothetical protein ACJW31_10G084000 [Castanea mollissima]